MGPLDEYRQANARHASVAVLTARVSDGDAGASHVGGTPLALPDEEWPCGDDQPLLFVCELYLTDAPLVPDLLKDVALLSLFVAADPGYWNQDNGDGWCLRAYPTLDGLEPMTSPGDSLAGTPCTVEWEIADDWPTYDDPERFEPDDLDEDEADQLENVAATKLGGWPSNIQSEQWWHYQEHEAAPRYCLQINSEAQAKLNIGDSGTIYLARGTAAGHEDEWFLDWQCF